jgi:hypothetical protein
MKHPELDVSKGQSHRRDRCENDQSNSSNKLGLNSAKSGGNHDQNVGKGKKHRTLGRYRLEKKPKSSRQETNSDACFNCGKKGN